MKNGNLGVIFLELLLGREFDGVQILAQ
jgi:hypothetical protein